MNKTELIEGIAKELYDSEEAYGEINAVATENDYEDVAERIVNKFFIHVVSQQREQLPIWLSSEAYICAKEVDFKEFHEWWCKQPNG